MGLWRIRAVVDEQPGRLAALAAAIAGRRGNILALSVQSDVGGTVDEFLADISAEPEVLRRSLESAGGRDVKLVPATAHELVDEATRGLLLAARLRSAPWRMPEILAELLRADDARWVHGRGGGAGVPDPALLVIAAGPRRAVRLRRSGLPFTLTEAARAAALVRIVQPMEETVTDGREIRLADGGTVQVRPLTRVYREAVEDLHRRCSSESRRLRYFSGTPALPARAFESFCDRGRGISLVAGHDGQVVALGHLIYTPDPGVGELAFLVEDRWQGRGLGTALARLLIDGARDKGLAEVRATMFVENHRMRRLLMRLGAAFHPSGEPGLVDARLPVGVAPAA